MLLTNPYAKSNIKYDFQSTKWRLQMAKKGTKVSPETAQSITRLISLLGSVAEVAKMLGIKRQTLRYRIKAGSFSTETALAIIQRSFNRRDELKETENEIEVGLIVCGDSCRLGGKGDKQCSE